MGKIGLARLCIFMTVLALLIGGAIWLCHTAPAPAKQSLPAAKQSPKTEPAKPASPPQPDKPYSPPPVHDPQLAALVDRNAKNRVSADLATRFPQAKPEDFPALLSVLSDAKDGDLERHEVAELLRRSYCPDLPDVLCKVLDNPDEQSRFRAFAMQQLWNVAADAKFDAAAREKAVAKIKAAVGDKDFQVRCQAMQNLCRLKDPKGKELAVKWFEDLRQGAAKAPAANPSKGSKAADPEFERGYVLGQAIRCCKDLELKDKMPAIRKFASDPNIVVARAAITVLADWHDEESLPAMEEAAKSSNPLLQSCGKAALAKMGKPTEDSLTGKK